MKRTIRLVLPVATLVVAFFATNGIGFATKEMAKTEKQPCTTCHEKGAPSKTNLNDVGALSDQRLRLDRRRTQLGGTEGHAQARLAGLAERRHKNKRCPRYYFWDSLFGRRNGLNGPLDAHREAERRSIRSSQLLHQPVVASPRGEGVLGPQRHGRYLKNRPGIVIQSADQPGNNFE